MAGPPAPAAAGAGAPSCRGGGRSAQPTVAVELALLGGGLQTCKRGRCRGGCCWWWPMPLPAHRKPGVHQGGGRQPAAKRVAGGLGPRPALARRGGRAGGVACRGAGELEHCGAGGGPCHSARVAALPAARASPAGAWGRPQRPRQYTGGGVRGRHGRGLPVQRARRGGGPGELAADRGLAFVSGLARRIVAGDGGVARELPAAGRRGPGPRWAVGRSPPLGQGQWGRQQPGQPWRRGLLWRRAPRSPG